MKGLKSLRTDSETLLSSEEVTKFLYQKGIDYSNSLPYAHHQNLVDRHVQTISKMQSAMMHSQRFLKASFWDYGLFHAVQIWNSTPNSKTGSSTPYMMFKGAKSIDFPEFDLPPHRKLIAQTQFQNCSLPSPMIRIKAIKVQNPHRIIYRPGPSQHK
jgi:hypothetical protein